jgi:hypothetical protein
MSVITLVSGAEDSTVLGVISEVVSRDSVAGRMSPATLVSGSLSGWWGLMWTCVIG